MITRRNQILEAVKLTEYRQMQGLQAFQIMLSLGLSVLGMVMIIIVKVKANQIMLITMVRVLASQKTRLYFVKEHQK